MAKKVLVVQRAAFIRMMIRDLLQKNGYEVVGECETAADALEQIAQHAPDLAITEIILRDDGYTDGLHLIREIAEQYPSTAILVFLNRTEEAIQAKDVIRAEAFRAGAQAFLTKPFQPSELLAKVKEALNA